MCLCVLDFPAVHLKRPEIIKHTKTVFAVFYFHTYLSSVHFVLDDSVIRNWII